MGKNRASAFYYPGLLFDFENCGNTRKKKKKKTSCKPRKIVQPSPLHPPFKKITFLSHSFNNLLRSADWIVCKGSDVSN